MAAIRSRSSNPARSCNIWLKSQDASCLRTAARASRLPVSLRIGWFDTVPAPQGYDAYSFGGEKVTEGVKPLNPNGEETASPLPPTQTIPLTLGADGTARSAVDVPTSLDGPASMRVEMDYQDEIGRAHV